MKRRVGGRREGRRSDRWTTPRQTVTTTKNKLLFPPGSMAFLCAPSFVSPTSLCMREVRLPRVRERKEQKKEKKKGNAWKHTHAHTHTHKRSILFCID
jgi:hypothetical protein